MRSPAMLARRSMACRIVAACLPGLTAYAPQLFAAEPVATECTKLPARSIDSLVCRSTMLASLDREMSRVYTLATAGGGAVASKVREQRSAWLARRAACAKSTTQEQCVRDLYVASIAAIRGESKAARSADDKGTSLGPFRFRCDGIDAPLEISYVNVRPGFAWVRIKDQGHLLLQQRSGSGARYEGNGTLFWEAAGEARWRATTGSPEVTCRP